MEYLPDFKVVRPATVQQAVAAYAAHADARYIAGGTDLMVNVRRGIVAPQTLIDIGGVAEITAIDAQQNGGVRIGAGVTLNELAAHGLIAKEYPAIAEAARQVAAPTHRQVATVGGNLCLDTRCLYYNQSEWWRVSNNYCLKNKGEVCHVAPSGSRCFAAFSGDLAPALMVFDAEVEISGPNGMRAVPLSEIYNDDGAAHLKLEKGEILTAVIIKSGDGWQSGYAKARVRGSIDFPLAGVAIALKRQGDRLSDIRVAFTGTNSYPVMLRKTEGLLQGPFDVDALTALLPKQITPMPSTFYPPGYRRKVAANLTRALARRLFEAAV